MTVCPYCGAEYLQGADLCDECQHSLTDLSIPEPKTAVEQGLLTDPIEVLVLRDPLTATPSETVGQVIQKMVDASIGCIVIVDGEQVRGIFTERDALLKVNADIDVYRDKPVSELMTPDPVTLNTNNRIAFALHKMHVGGYRHIPILKNGTLVGVISIRRILEYLTQRIDEVE